MQADGLDKLVKYLEREALFYDPITRVSTSR